MKLPILFFLALFATCFSNYCLAQAKATLTMDSTVVSDTSDTGHKKQAKSRYIDISVEYGSNFTYHNLIDQTAAGVSPYLYPSIYYHDKTGIWASIGTYRILGNYVELSPVKNAAASHTDTTIAPNFIETDFSIGWDHKFWGNTDVTASFMYSLYDRNYNLVFGALRNTFEGYVGHDFKLLNSGLRYDYCFENFTATLEGKRINFDVSDNYLMWETSREWFIDDVFKHGDEFDIAPMFTIFAGTENFIGKTIVARFPDNQLATKDAAILSEFLIQQFTLSIPVAYTIGNFTLTPSFEYTILTQKVTETSPTMYPIYRFSLAYRFNFK